MEKKKQKISPLPIKKSVLKTLAQNDFSAVLEDINDKFTVMVEGLEGLRGEFYAFRDDMNGLREETRSNFTSVFEYLSRIDDELSDIKKELVKIKDEKSDKPYVKGLEMRVSKLEIELASIRNEMRMKKV
jgi:hypothetical protein